MVVESVEKCPASFEPYQCTLSDDLQKLAKEQLGEDEAIREHSLGQLRDWIAKHPYIRKCRTDARFLLRFLRHRKYSVPKAQESIERYLVVRQRLPEWYQKLDPRDATLKQMLDELVLSVLGHDENGRLVLLARMGRFNTDNLIPMHLFRFLTMLSEYLLDNDESLQVAGLRIWIDHSNTPLKYFGLWGINDLKVSMESISKLMPFRLYEVRFAELASTATSLINMAMSMGGPKLKERVTFYSTVEESKPHFEEKLWIKEYGGSLDAAELNRKLGEQLEKARDELLALDEMEIDVEHYSALWKLDLNSGEIDGGIAGNFRKLEVD
ncbi:hypothetical protein quinque_003126 [Culex quinquefasciatus]|uniref:uncharacterized protein LOC6047327 n=1 Tax=Culex quinquefasciatus TaxID=7176 RepID=UPI0018E2FB8E|nr:uncharacterized protein LOC6047327 [Culex quinquefasciatus]XP_039444956.1 uncharacterized protein LOC120424807 [Culex pipiens pallens]